MEPGFETGWNNIVAFVVSGEMPPLCWCGFVDVANFLMHLWGNFMIATAYVVFPWALWRINKWAPNRELWTPPVWTVVAVAIFVPMCGSGHVLDNWKMFSGMVELEARWMSATGLASMVAQVGLWLHGSDLKRRFGYLAQTA